MYAGISQSTSFKISSKRREESGWRKLISLNNWTLKNCIDHQNFNFVGIAKIKNPGAVKQNQYTSLALKLREIASIHIAFDELYPSISYPISKRKGKTLFKTITAGHIKA